MPSIASLGWSAAVLLASSSLLAPAVAQQAFELQGTGVHIYTCNPTAAGFAWVLKAPDAKLLDGLGREVGHHFAGPSWAGQDGSSVVGEVETASSGGPGSIPWLVLRAKSNAGQGMFSMVKSIVRTRTQGGPAPTTGCDAARAGAQTEVSYSATYIFFPQ